jgi:hypothetical protein
VDQNDSVAVATSSPPGGRYINRFRLYRSNVGSVSAGFQFVDEWPVNQLTYTDEKKASELQEICPSLTWAEPPATLKGLVGMPNGVIAGFVGNSVSFCETNYQYAWPVEYQISTEQPIVAMAPVWANTGGWHPRRAVLRQRNRLGQHVVTKDAVEPSVRFSSVDASR